MKTPPELSRAAATANAFEYTGRENDGTGLHYYQARYYDPGLQRFISEDPIGILGGDVNLYAYVGNAPLLFTDPFGLDKCSDTFGAVLRNPAKYLSRFPDYVTFSFFPKQLQRYGFAPGITISIDQKGNVFVGGGAAFERSYSLMAGWVARPEYREASVENLLTQASVTGTVAARGFAGGLTASSECHAVELGVSSGSGVAGTYGKRVGNLLDWLGL